MMCKHQWVLNIGDRYRRCMYCNEEQPHCLNRKVPGKWCNKPAGHGGFCFMVPVQGGDKHDPTGS